jgi:hypothetical protein
MHEKWTAHHAISTLGKAHTNTQSSSPQRGLSLCFVVLKFADFEIKAHLPRSRADSRVLHDAAKLQKRK